MEHVRIETAQNVVVDHEVAPLGDRIVAYLLDTLVLVAWVILMFMLMAMIEPDDDGVLFLVMMAMIIFPFLFYHLVMELSLNGQSIGKRVRKIKVSRLDGGRPSFGQYLLRWVLRPIDSFYYIGLVVILINGRGQRLGDLAAGTTIVSLKRRVKLAETLAEELPLDHEVQFPEVVRLNDAQVRLVREVLRDPRRTNHWQLVERTADKVQEVIGGDRRGLLAQPYLKQVLRDYVHLTGQLGPGTGHFVGRKEEGSTSLQ